MIQAIQTETTYIHPKDSYIHPRDLIKAKLWTYEEAASAFEVELSTIWRWMSGRVTPHKRYYRKATELARL